MKAVKQNRSAERCGRGVQADELGLSRRRLFRAGVTGAAAGLLAGGGLAFPVQALAETGPATPEAAIAALKRGNKRFAANALVSVDADLDLIRRNAVNGQRPFAAVLSCADSRVPVEWMFDVIIGRVFVCRVAGNIATPENIASLEFAVAALGAKAILVLGHGACGAVDAARELTRVEGTQISSLYSFITPAVAHATTLDEAIADNAQFQAALLGDASPVLSDRVAAGTLKIVAGVYDLRTGLVEFLE